MLDSRNPSPRIERVFGLSRFSLSRFIFSNRILFIIPTQYYSCSQPNRLESTAFAGRPTESGNTVFLGPAPNELPPKAEAHGSTITGTRGARHVRPAAVLSSLAGTERDDPAGPGAGDHRPGAHARRRPRTRARMRTHRSPRREPRRAPRPRPHARLAPTVVPRALLWSAAVHGEAESAPASSWGFSSASC